MQFVSLKDSSVKPNSIINITNMAAKHLGGGKNLSAIPEKCKAEESGVACYIINWHNPLQNRLVSNDYCPLISHE